MLTAPELLHYIFLSAVNHQITTIVTESLLFKGFRRAVAARSRYLGELVSCQLCFGTWVGFLLALVFRPRFVEAPPLENEPASINRWFRRTAVLLGDGFAIALGGRFFLEILGLLRREVAVKEEEKQLLEHEVNELTD